MIATDRDLDWIVDRVRANYDASTIYLFGSHAKGTPRPSSDIDLLIIGPSRLPRFRRGRQVAAALTTFPAHFDLLFYTQPELTQARRDPLSFISTILTNAQILYQRPDQRRGLTTIGGMITIADRQTSTNRT
jgi:predicted nucleotidyltransferase